MLMENDVFGFLKKRWGTSAADENPAKPAPEPGLSVEPEPLAEIPSRPDVIVTRFLDVSDMAVSFADPNAPDQALIYVNDAFVKLTGYAREECVGVNCRFLQGSLTRKSESNAIRRGIMSGTFLLTRLLNYRRDGSIFDNAVQIGQLRDTRGEVRFLFGLQWDVSETLKRLDASATEDLRDRTLNPRLRMLDRLANHLVRRSIEMGRGVAGVPLVERLVVISRPYQFPTPDPRPDRAGIHALCTYLLEPYGYVEGSNLSLSGETGSFASEFAGTLAMWLHEMVSITKSIGEQYGPAATVLLSWGFPTEKGKPMIAFNWNKSVIDANTGARHHRPFSTPNLVGGSGAVLTREIVAFAGGRIRTQAWDSGIDGTLVIPNEAWSTGSAPPQESSEPDA